MVRIGRVECGRIVCALKGGHLWAGIAKFTSVDRSGVGQESNHGITGLTQYRDYVQRLGMTASCSKQTPIPQFPRILASLTTNPNPRADSTFARSAPILATIFILFGIGYTIDYNSKSSTFARYLVRLTCSLVSFRSQCT